MTDKFTQPWRVDQVEFQDSDSLRLILESILSSVPDAMIVINDMGTILAFSRAAERLFGYAADETLGKNVSFLMTSNDQQHHDQYIRNYLKTGEKQIIGIGRIVEAQLSDGSRIPVDLKIGEAQIGDQKVFTGFIRDVTERQSAAHKMTALQVELGNFSRLSAVGTMASAMAHELNQPLTAVANYLEAARDILSDPDDETIATVREALSSAATQSIRAGQIVRRLRDYVSRGELDLRNVALESVVEEAVSLSKVGIEGPLARIVVKQTPEHINVMADRLQLRQVFVNLTRNAIEALAGVETPMIWIETALSGPDVVVIVRDNGPGFSEDVSDSVFDPFQSTKNSGMGLGLSICQTIIEAHGSVIEAKSKPGQGAQFSFTLRPAD